MTSDLRLAELLASGSDDGAHDGGRTGYLFRSDGRTGRLSPADDDDAVLLCLESAEEELD